MVRSISSHSIAPASVLRGDGAWDEALPQIKSLCSRPLRRAVMRLLEDSLAEEVLSGRIKDGDHAEVDVDENKKVVVRHKGQVDTAPQLAGASV